MPLPGWRRAFGWLRRDTARAVDEELRAHIDMKADELRAAGLSADEARRRARASFGDLRAIRRESLRIQSQVRRQSARADVLDGLIHDVRYSLRGLRRSPAFSVVAIVTLALGIGANTAIFSVVNGLVLRPLPGIARPDRLVEIAQGDGDDFVSVSYPVFDHVRRNATTLEDFAAFDVVSLAIADGGAPEVLFGLQVTGNYFEVLGTRPARGRFFATEQSFHPVVEDAIVISHALWQRRFGGAEDVIGRAVTLSGYPARIVGVAPAGFGGHIVAVKADFFVPVGMPAPEMHRAASLGRARDGVLETIGRLADGVSIDGARAEVAALASAFIEEQEGAGAVYPMQTTPYGAVPGRVRPGTTIFLGILMFVVGLLLLISCVNVANMLLSRAAARGREIAVRLSVGAGRERLVRQLMTESLVLAGLGAVAGTLMAVWLTRLLVAFRPPVLPFPGMRLELDFGIDAGVLLFTAAVAAITAVVFGSLPALRSTRPEVVSALKDGGIPGGRRSARLRGVMVAAQMATTVVLLLGAGLFLRALQAAQSIDTGFDTESVFVAGVDLGLNDYDDRQATRFYDQLLQRSGVLPGIDGAALAGKLPLAGASSTTMTVPGVEARQSPADSAGGLFSLHNQSVSAGYFRVLGLPLLRGRTFTDADRADTGMVAVVNETLADRFWGVDGAVGQRFVIFGDTEVEVVGVVADAKYHDLVEDTPLFAYFPYRQRPRTDMVLHLKGGPGADPELFWQALRDTVASVDDTVPLLSAAPLEEALRVFRLPQLIAAWITGVTGILGLLLGSVGIYGVTAYTASRRRHEIGVRIALGAAGTDVRRMMVRQGMRAPLVGIALGLVVALAVTRLLAAFLVGVSPLDPTTFVAVPGALTAVALLATSIPAHRTARVDPVTTLKAD